MLLWQRHKCLEIDYRLMILREVEKKSLSISQQRCNFLEWFVAGKWSKTSLLGTMEIYIQYKSEQTVAPASKKYQNHRKRNIFSLNIFIIKTHCTVCRWTLPSTCNKSRFVRKNQIEKGCRLNLKARTRLFCLQIFLMRTHYCSPLTLIVILIFL